MAITKTTEEDKIEPSITEPMCLVLDVPPVVRSPEVEDMIANGVMKKGGKGADQGGGREGA